MDRSLCFCLGLLLSACGLEGSDPPGPGLGTARDPELEYQGFQNQGFQNQGFENAALSTPLHGFSLSSLLDGGSTVDRAVLYQGELQVLRSAVDPTPSFAPCAGTTSGVARGCGFRPAGIGLCTPGASVTLGSGGSCGPSCTGDPVVRVCDGTAGCEHGSGAVLAEGDDSCGTLCPSVGFTCPASGAFSVMSAPYGTWAPGYSDTLAASGASYPEFNQVLRATGLAGLTIDGVRAGGERVPMYIASVLAETPGYAARVGPGSTYRYELQYWADGGLVDLCGPDDDSPWADGAPVAIPVAGYWDETGARVDDPDRVTFACRRGVISKCYRWGYRPWDSAPDARGVSTSLRDYHLACTRMARADYCGDGRSYTRYNTPIDVWDHLAPPLQARAPDSGMPFEAGWSTQGALCLSHKRWSDASDLVYTCPRLAPNGPGSEKVCDDEQGVPAGALLFNESDYNLGDGGFGE